MGLGAGRGRGPRGGGTLKRSCLLCGPSTDLSLPGILRVEYFLCLQRGISIATQI